MPNNIETNQEPLYGLLVLVNTGENDEQFYYQYEELKNLCAASNIISRETIIQNRDKIDPITYVGSGKIEEIKQAALLYEVDVVIFNNELSPKQLRNISSFLPDLEIWDKTMLILNLFEQRAKTKEAALQVEIAKLKYSLSRLVGARSYLSRTGGGGGGAGGARRGLGETQLELDRRQIGKKIGKAEEELASIVKARLNSRKSRHANEMKIVALVGYTNVGKSSLVNALLKKLGTDQGEEKEVFVKDMLFATLDTSTRYFKLSNNHEFLLTDTVGFVSNLPHHLITSFKSTLEEITEADLIIHLIDASSPFRELQMETTIQVINELGCQDLPILNVYNKCDLLRNELGPDFIKISALTGDGLSQLLTIIDQRLYPQIHLDKFLIPYSKGEIYTLFKEKAEVLTTDYTNDGIEVLVKVSPYLHNLYQPYLISSKNDE